MRYQWHCDAGSCNLPMDIADFQRYSNGQPEISNKGDYECSEWDFWAAYFAFLDKNFLDKRIF